MRRILLFMSIIVTSIASIYAQTKYFPENSRWQMLGVEIPTCLDCDPLYIYENIFTDSDTIINSKVYQTLRIYPNDFYILSKDYYIRSEGDKLYGYAKSDKITEERLLADFSLHVGDSLPFYDLRFTMSEPASPSRPYYDTLYSYVTMVDTILLNDGRQAKRITYDKYRCPALQHIGTERGVWDLFSTYKYDADEPLFATICYLENENVVYSQVFKPEYSEYDFIKNNFCAQRSTSMFPVGTSWSVVHYPCWGYSELTAGYQKIIGDTTINDTLYQIVTPMGYFVEPYLDYDNSAVYIREEDKKVYIRNNENREYLLYDFTLEAGDSIINLVSSEFSDGILYYNKVVSVEYVTLGDGRQAKSLMYDHIRGRDIEFVGNLSGFLSPVSDITTCGDGWGILCCSVDESLLYQSGVAVKYGCNLENYNPSKVEDIISKEPVATKYIENDQIFIILGGKCYNLLGAEVK